MNTLRTIKGTNGIFTFDIFKNENEKGKHDGWFLKVVTDNGESVADDAEWLRTKKECIDVAKNIAGH